MKRLLSIELQKIWKNKASRILTITYFIFLSLIALIASIKFDIGPFKFHLAEMGIFNFPFIWHFNTYIAAILKFFLAIGTFANMSTFTIFFCTFLRTIFFVFIFAIFYFLFAFFSVHVRK